MLKGQMDMMLVERARAAKVIEEKDRAKKRKRELMSAIEESAIEESAIEESAIEESEREKKSRHR